MRGEDSAYLDANNFPAMKKICFLLLILFAARTVFAQSEEKTCALPLTDAPAVFNLKLGMSPAAVKTVFGKKLKLNVKRKGTFFQNFIDKSPPAFLPNVRALYLRFFDRRLYQIEVFYREIKPETAAPSAAETEEFVASLSARLNLPAPSLWKNDFGKYQLKCDGFSIAADRILNPRVELTDDAQRALFEESQK